jgi:hypothetical protein
MAMEFATRKLRAATLTWAILLMASLTACVGVQATPEQVAAAGGGSAARVLGGAASMGGRMFIGAGGKSADLAIAVMDSGPAPDAGFLSEPGRMVMLDRSQHPFQRVWVAPTHDRERYRKVVVAPVVIEHMLDNSWWDNMSTAAFFGLEDDAARLAERLQRTVEQAFREDPNRRFEVLDEPDDETLILELALVEIVPNKSVLALGAIAAMAASPVISSPIGFVASQTEHGFMAIEGRVRDGATGEVVAMFSDRETAKTRVLDLQSVMWYGHAYEIFDEWAEQLVAVANHPADPGIGDPRPFTLKPW